MDLKAVKTVFPASFHTRLVDMAEDYVIGYVNHFESSAANFSVY